MLEWDEDRLQTRSQAPDRLNAVVDQAVNDPWPGVAPGSFRRWRQPGELPART